MFPILAFLIPLLLALGAPPEVAAKQKGFAGIIEERQQASSGASASRGSGDLVKAITNIDTDTLETVLVYGGIALAMLVGLALLYNLYSRWRFSAELARREQERQMHFADQAKGLGFKLAETRLLKRVVSRLSPEMSTALLTTPAGRFYLINDLQKRLRQREQELQVLEAIRDKLEKVRHHQLHERESVRVEADLPVWVAPKREYRGPGQEQEGDGLDIDLGQVAGQLLDLSEGGAALSTVLEVKRGDMVEFWSRDSEIWIPPITAGVVQVEEGKDSRPSLLHLHFLSPPSAELKAVLEQLQEDLPTLSG